MTSATASSAAVLHTEIVHGHALDVTELGRGNDHALVRNHIFHGNIRRIEDNLRLSFVAVFILDDEQLVLNNAKKQILVCQDCLQVLDRLHQFRVFILNLASLLIL